MNAEPPKRPYDDRPEDQRLVALAVTMIGDQIATAVESISEVTGKPGMQVFMEMFPTVVIHTLDQNIRREGLMPTTHSLCQLVIQSMEKKIERDQQEHQETPE